MSLAIITAYLIVKCEKFKSEIGAGTSELPSGPLRAFRATACPVAARRSSRLVHLADSIWYAG